MELNLKDKVVILTGATGGIGRQICADFINEGANVVAVYRSEAKLEELLTWLSAKKIDKNKVFSSKTNVLSKSEIDTCVKETILKFGKIDILVNCAGASFELPFAMLEEHQIEDMININFRSPVLFSQSVLRIMFKQREGCIVNISTLAAHAMGRGIVVYASAKAGLDAFTRTLAQEIGRKNIRINSVRPGVIDTEMSSALINRSKDFLLTGSALNCFGKPEDISSAVLFLSSPTTASFITGTTLNVDGGLNL